MIPVTKVSSYQDPPPEPGRLPLSGNCTVMVDRAVNESLGALVEASTVIVEGTVQAIPGTRNLSYDKNLMIEGVDHEIAAERYLKGDGPSTLTISLVRSHLSPGEEKACPYSDYHELKVGDRFFLFLEPDPYNQEIYAGAGYPWIYYVRDDRVGPEFGPGDLYDRDDFLAQLQ